MADTRVPKSCLSCPSFLTPAAAIGRFRKSIGAPVCGTYGHVLGSPRANNAQNARTAQVTAKDCPSHGQPMTPTPKSQEFNITLPDPAMQTELPALAAERQRVASCAMCKKFAPDEVVVEKFGYTSGLCTATGNLVLPDKLVEVARGCAFKSHGPVRRDISSMLLQPALNDPSPAGGSDPIGMLWDHKAKFVDPSEYPTDAPVSDEDKEQGIRAWRRLVDPEGSGNEIFLPIFDLDSFTENERARIPKATDEEKPHLYVDHNGAVYRIAVLWRALDESPAIWGIPGVGKTEVYRHLAYLMCLPFYRFSITGSSELDDLAGKMRYDKDRGTYFQDGRFTRAWQRRAVVCLDEPNTGPAEVWQFFRPMTDNSKQFVLDVDDGRTVKRNDHCYFGMAMNPAWDPRNIGTAVIGAADGSRLMHLYFDMPPEAVERQIISDRVREDGWIIDETRLNFLIEAGKLIREQSERDVISATWAIREQIKVARALRWFDAVTAYKMAVADMLSPEQQHALIDVVTAQLSPFSPIMMVEEDD